MSVLTPERTLPVAPPAPPSQVGPNVVKQQLLDAADLIELHGHAKSMLVKMDGSICMYEALTRAYGIEPSVFGEAETTFSRMKGTRSPGEIVFESRLGSVCYFNNSHTKAECLNALRAVAASL